MYAGKEIYRFVYFSDGEWLCLIPEGFYNASANGAAYLNLHYNKQTFSADRFQKILFRPDLVQAGLTGDPDRKIHESGQDFITKI
ncbi:MAG: hypothetical protein GY749_41745 [Desulfobacteraceae bacterium]|nr:hypothetical protein [Desulfobacteraceae bacterium]